MRAEYAIYGYIRKYCLHYTGYVFKKMIQEYTQKWMRKPGEYVLNVIIGIVVVLVLSVFAIILYPVTLIGILLYHFLKAQKMIRKIEGNEPFFEKYKTISRPIVLVNGLLFILTSGVCFSVRMDWPFGFIFYLLFLVGVYISTTKTLIPSLPSDEPQTSKWLTNKAVLSVASFFMCMFTCFQLVTYTPPVVAASAPPQVAVVDESISTTKPPNVIFSADPTAEPTPQPTVAPTEEPTPQPTVAPTEEPTPQPITESTKEPTPQPTTESTEEPTPQPATESTEEPTPSIAVAENGGTADSETHFNDYNTPEQQNTTMYVLNTSTMKVHESYCSDVKRIKPENYSTIESLSDALNNGYVPCKRCNPHE